MLPICDAQLPEVPGVAIRKNSTNPFPVSVLVANLATQRGSRGHRSSTPPAHNPMRSPWWIISPSTPVHRRGGWCHSIQHNLELLFSTLFRIATLVSQVVGRHISATPRFIFRDMLANLDPRAQPTPKLDRERSDMTIRQNVQCAGISGKQSPF